MTDDDACFQNLRRVSEDPFPGFIILILIIIIIISIAQDDAEEV